MGDRECHASTGPRRRAGHGQSGLTPDRLPARPPPSQHPVSSVSLPHSALAPDGDAAPAAILHEVFGYAQFRGPQAAIVDHVVAGGDALVLMPTGGGKSLCYQIPALCRDGVAIVVSPLIALM